MKYPAWALNTISRNLNFVDSMKLIIDPRFFYDIRVVHLQRQVNDAQAEYFLKFLKPLSENIGFWICYSVDDVIKYEDIPKYNFAREVYNNKQFFANVTTDILKQYYVDNYGIQENKVVVIPNYLPRWWVGEIYDIAKQKASYSSNRNKPRIGIPLSSSHYDVKGINDWKDDLTGINNFIRNTTDKYQWVFMGHVPKKLEDLAKDGKIEVIPGSDLLNYPRELWQRGRFQAIVTPLEDNIFNRCKSNIKLIEGWSLGIPVIAQDLPCYSKYTDCTFKDENELQNQLDRVLGSKARYTKMIEHNRNIVDHGDEHAPNGWWLEKNLKRWYQMYTLPQRTIKINLQQIEEAAKKKNPTDNLPKGGLEVDLSI